MDRILGVDFSGARDAGRKIWLTVCVERDGELHVKNSVHAATQFGVEGREACLRGVRTAVERADVVGLNFPFGLPSAVHDFDDWRTVVEWIGVDVEGPRALHDTCVERARASTDGRRSYLRRETDHSHAALSPYHWFVAARTYYGIRTVVRPLLVDGTITVRPMQSGSATPVCEVSPASTLRSIGLPATRYRTDGEDARQRRRTIVDGLQMTPLVMHGIEDHLVDDVGGDAIDSLLAALAAWRASREEFSPDRAYDPIEGHIYV